MPAGLSLVDGVLSGTPTQSGFFSLQITVTDSNSTSVKYTYSFNIAPAPLTIDSAALNAASQGRPYSFQFNTVTTGGHGNYAFTLSAGTLPTGLTLNPTTGVLSGTTTQSGDFSFSITVIDSWTPVANSVTGNFTLHIVNTNNQLIDVVFSPAIVLSPVFNSSTHTYNCDIPETIQQFTITSSAEDANIDRIELWQDNEKLEQLESSQSSSLISLPLGNSVLVMKVYAEDGAAQLYMIEMRRACQVNTDEQTISTSDLHTAITIGDGIDGSRLQATNTTTNPDNSVSVTLGFDVEKRDADLGTITLQTMGPVTFTGPDGWDGSIMMPTVKAVPSVKIPDAQTVTAVIEIGMSGQMLTMDDPVRLFIPGQGGKECGYIQNGVFHKITRIISDDTLNVADSEIPDFEEGYIVINSGQNLVIWTKHMTEFVTYTKKSGSGSIGGSGGGGGAVVVPTSKIGSDGGTVSAHGCSIDIPKGALDTNTSIKIQNARAGIGSALDENMTMLKGVYEIIADPLATMKKAATVTINLNNKDLNNSQDVALYYSDGDKWVKLDNQRVNLSEGIVKGDTTKFGKFAVIAIEKIQTPSDPPTAPEVVLTDVNGHWAESSIYSLAQQGVVSGNPEGTFKPDNQVTRAEFATMLVNALKLNMIEGKIFNDTASHWAKEFIATAYANGIIKGYNDQEFGPDDSITREQMAVMIATAMKLPDASGGIFTDQDKISEWAKNSVAAASAAKVMNGYPDGSFKPLANATRAEAATVLSKALASK